MELVLHFLAEDAKETYRYGLRASRDLLGVGAAAGGTSDGGVI